jgi:hypothetical protein
MTDTESIAILALVLLAGISLGVMGVALFQTRKDN